MNQPEKQHISIAGIVSHRDAMPYLKIDLDGHTVQLSMAEARDVAANIATACARVEADAIIHKFFSAMEYPQGASAAIMLAFRDFRNELDDEPVERSRTKPDDETRGRDV